MPSTESGLEGPGIAEPKPEVGDISTDAGFRKHLESQPGGDSLPASAREWGAPGSANRKAYVQREMDAGQKAAEARVASLAEFQAVITAEPAGSWKAGLTVPDDSPPAPAPVVDTAEVDRLRQELTTTRASLTEAQEFEAMQAARDSLEEAETQQDFLNTMAELRDTISPNAWSMFAMESLGDQLIEPEELEQFNQVWQSERAFESAYEQAEKSQGDADKLKKSQIETLEGERERLGLNKEAWGYHEADMAEAARQLGLNFDNTSAEEYKEIIPELSALVSDARRAYSHAAFQEAVVGSENTVESGLTIMGQPVSPREPIEPQLDYGRMLAHSNRGKKVDVAAGVLAEEKKSTGKADDIAALARKTDRDIEAKQARVRKARGGF